MGDFGGLVEEFGFGDFVVGVFGVSMVDDEFDEVYFVDYVLESLYVGVGNFGILRNVV